MNLFNRKSDKKVGLALGGGATLGGAHVGVLRALEETEISIDYIAGTSIGAMVGALYAFGMPVDEIEQIALNLDWPDISGLARLAGHFRTCTVEKRVAQQ